MVREVEEEINCVPTAFRLLETVDEPDPHAHGPGQFHVFVVTEWSGHEPQLANDEHDQLGWFTLDDVRQLMLADPSYIDLLSRAGVRA